MPKNLQSGARSKAKLKSSRKPLREVSYAEVNPSPELNRISVNKKNDINVNKVPNPRVSQNEEEERNGDDSINRLLAIHSDLSSLVHQIDDLVGKALIRKVTSKNDRDEIESFAQVLSEIQVSLKPWVPRFQKSISSHSLGSESQLEKSLSIRAVDASVNDGLSKVVDSPDQTKWDSLVSPSPLVSWRAGCANEAGRQLFLLTPLPKPAISSKLRGSSKSVFENLKTDINVDDRPPLPHFLIPKDLKNDLVEGVVANPNSTNVSDSSVTFAETTMKCEFKSPEKYSKIDFSLVAMTPRVEVSPPKSCILLEPISEFNHKKIFGVRKSTPFPTGFHNINEYDDSDSSSSEASGHLISKYAELAGMKVHEMGNRKKVVEASPKWCMSPPKTCIVMEPPEEKMLSTSSYCQLPRTACAPSWKTKKESKFRGPGDSLAAVASTPTLKEPESYIRKGKHPGENTLKKELWTKFEAATTSGIRFSKQVCEGSANKGFLHLLEEVSSDDERDTAPQVNRR